MSDDENEILEGDDVEMDETELSLSSESSSDDFDTSGREHLRQQLQSDVEAFLAAGGRINEIPPNVVADPPRKPQSNYGGQPI